jgi:hypothetical protein
LRHIGTKPIGILLSSRECRMFDPSSLAFIDGEGGGHQRGRTSPAHQALGENVRFPPIPASSGLGLLSTHCRQ